MFGLNIRRVGFGSRLYHSQKANAKEIMKKSCYNGVNFVINQDASVYDAIKRMAGINLGCLTVSNDQNEFVGVITERDYMKKVELQNLTAKTCHVKDIMTARERVCSALLNETPNQMMTKMLSRVGFFMIMIHYY